MTNPARYGATAKATRVRLRKEEKSLSVDFDDGRSFEYPAELLRVESPSAEVQGHGPSQKKIVAGRRHVNIINVEPVGNYAVRLVFDDLHDSGIYSWSWLHDLGCNMESRWQAYLAGLDSAGLSRDP